MIPLNLVALALVAVAAVSGIGGSWVRGWRADVEMAAVRMNHAHEIAAASQDAQEREAQARVLERKTTLRVMEAADAANLKSSDARAAAAVADVAAGELRRAYETVAAALAGRAGQDPAAAAGSTPANGPGLVLTDVFGGVEGLLREAGAALDQARIAGLACERSYDAASEVTRP